MYEGKNIHYSPSDNKRLCSYSVKLCKQRRLNGYSLCLRHVLEDPEAPYRRCLYMAKNKQQCTNPIHKQSDAQFCTSHMQLMGVTPTSGVTSIQNSVTPSSKPTPNINSANLNSVVGVNISDCINKTCNNESGIQNSSPIKATVVGANNIKNNIISDDNPNESTVKLVGKSNVVNSSSMLQLDRNCNVSHCNLVQPIHLMGSYVMNSNRELVAVPSMGLSLATVGSKEAKLGDALHTGTTMPSVCRDNSLLMTDIAGCKSPISNQVLASFSDGNPEVKFSNVQISQQTGFSSSEIRFSQISHQPGLSINNTTRTEPIYEYKSTENILTNCASCNTSTLTPSQPISFVGIRGLSSSPAGHSVISQVAGLNSLLALRSPLLLGDSNHLLRKPPDVSINSANPNIGSSIGLNINQKPHDFLQRAQFPATLSAGDEKIVSVPIFQSGGVVSNVPILLSQVRPACLSPRPPSANSVIGMSNSATSTMPTILTWPFPIVATNLRPVVTQQGTVPSGGQDLTNMKMSLSQILNKLLSNTMPGAAVSNSATLPASTSSQQNSQRIASENNASKMIPTQNFSMSNTSHGTSDLLSADSLLKSVTPTSQITNKGAECVIVNTSDSAFLEKDNIMVPGTLSTAIMQAASSNVPSLSASQPASIAWPCMLGSRVVSSALYSPNKPIISSPTTLSTAVASVGTSLISSPLSSAALVTVPAMTSAPLLLSSVTTLSTSSQTTTSSIFLASSTVTTSTRSYQLPISHSTFKSLSPSAALANSWQTQLLSALMASVTSLSPSVTTASNPVSSAGSETTGSVPVQTGLSKPVLSSIQTGDGGINLGGELETSKTVSNKDVVKSKKKSQKRNSQKSKSDSLVSEVKNAECIKPDIIITPPIKESQKRSSYGGKKSTTLLGFCGIFKNEHLTDEEGKVVTHPPAKRRRISDGAKTEKTSKHAGVSHSANSLRVPTPEPGLSATSAPRYMHSIGGYSKKCCMVQSRGSDLRPRERGLLEGCRGPMRHLVEGCVRERREGRCLVPTGVDSSDDEGGGDSDYQLPWQRARCCLSSDESDLSDNGDLDEDTDASNRLGELHKIKCRLQRSFLIGQSCSHDNRLLWRRELKRTALLVAVLRYGRDREAAAVLEGLMRGGRVADRCGVRGTRGSDKISGRRGCLHKDDDDVLCSGVALPYTNHCIRHITYNVDQQLFDYCSVKGVDGTQCSAPVFNSTYAQPICTKHAQEMEPHKLTTDGDLDIKPKKVRKKTKPSALTRPPRKGKKKRLQRKLASVLQDIRDEDVSGVDSNNDLQSLLGSCDQAQDSYSQQLSSYSPQKNSSVLQLSSFSQQKGSNVQQLGSYLQQKDDNVQQLSSYSQQKQGSLQQDVDAEDTGAPRGMSRVSDLFEGGDYTSLFLNEGLCKDTLALNEGEDLEEPFSPDTIARQLDTLEGDHGSGLFDVTSDLQFVFSRLHDVESFDLLSDLKNDNDSSNLSLSSRDESFINVFSHDTANLSDANLSDARLLDESSLSGFDFNLLGSDILCRGLESGPVNLMNSLNLMEEKKEMKIFPSKGDMEIFSPVEEVKLESVESDVLEKVDLHDETTSLDGENQLIECQSMADQLVDRQSVIKPIDGVPDDTLSFCDVERRVRSNDSGVHDSCSDECDDVDNTFTCRNIVDFSDNNSARNKCGDDRPCSTCRPGRPDSTDRPICSDSRPCCADKPRSDNSRPCCTDWPNCIDGWPCSIDRPSDGRPCCTGRPIVSNQSSSSGSSSYSATKSFRCSKRTRSELAACEVVSKSALCITNQGGEECKSGCNIVAAKNRRGSLPSCILTTSDRNISSMNICESKSFHLSHPYTICYEPKSKTSTNNEGKLQLSLSETALTESISKHQHDIPFCGISSINNTLGSNCNAGDVTYCNGDLLHKAEFENNGVLLDTKALLNSVALLNKGGKPRKVKSECKVSTTTSPKQSCLTDYISSSSLSVDLGIKSRKNSTRQNPISKITDLPTNINSTSHSFTSISSSGCDIRDVSGGLSAMSFSISLLPSDSLIFDRSSSEETEPPVRTSSCSSSKSVSSVASSESGVDIGDGGYIGCLLNEDDSCAGKLMRRILNGSTVTHETPPVSSN